MTMEYFPWVASILPIQVPAAIAASGNTPGLDLKPYDGQIGVILTSLNTAGTLPTLAAKLQTAQETNLVGAVALTGTGNGRLLELVGKGDTVAETITVTFSSASAFTVSGSVTGAMGSGTVGTKFTSPQISFIAYAGSTAFVNTDTIAVVMSARVYADVPNGAFAGLTTGSSVQMLALNSDALGQYLRVAFTLGGTVSPSYVACVSLLAMAQNAA